MKQKILAKNLEDKVFYLCVQSGYRDYHNTLCYVHEHPNDSHSMELFRQNGSTSRCFGVPKDKYLEVILKETNPEYFL